MKNRVDGIIAIICSFFLSAWLFVVVYFFFQLSLILKDVARDIEEREKSIEERGWHGHVLTPEDKAKNREYLDEVQTLR